MSGDVTRILNAIEQGDVRAADELLPAILDELRLLTTQKLLPEPPGPLLQTAILIHVSHIRLLGAEKQNGNNRGKILVRLTYFRWLGLSAP